MCDFGVQVTFNTQNYGFTFAPNTVTVPKKTVATICLNLSPVLGAKFTNFYIDNGADFSWRIANTQIVVTDNNQDSGDTTHNYQVTVEYNGQHYTSDPQIVNRG